MWRLLLPGLSFALGLGACVQYPQVADYESPPAYRGPPAAVDVHLGAYPQLALVPGYPVYYDPYGTANYFFYDGRYWLYQYDNWYSSSWYNGPWGVVGPRYVPYYLLRVPVRYYRAPPPHFRNWHRDEPPHWGEQWGGDSEHDHRDREHDHRDRKRRDQQSVPPAAPLPEHQQQSAPLQPARSSPPEQQAQPQPPAPRHQPSPEGRRSPPRRGEGHSPKVPPPAKPDDIKTEQP